jgi:hypothetical protein
MLTILAHLVFWPALFWNMVFWFTALERGFNRRTFWVDMRDSVISLAALLGPGIYLFGIF